VKRRLIVLAAVAIALALLSKFVVSPYFVVGESMTPTLHDMDFCLMQKVWHYRPKRGDIVAFRTVDDPPLFFVKRVVALPGETIAIRGGNVEINGTPLPDQYTTTNPDWEMAATPVPGHEVFVIGDKRTVGLDETVHGLVATRLVAGRLIAHWRWKR